MVGDTDPLTPIAGSRFCVIPRLSQESLSVPDYGWFVLCGRNKCGFYYSATDVL